MDKRRNRKRSNWNNQRNQQGKNQNQNQNQNQNSEQKQKKTFQFNHTAYENEESKLERQKAIQEVKAREVICAKCGQPITEIASSLSDKKSGEPIHFECALNEVQAGETLGENEKIAYIGQPERPCRGVGDARGRSVPGMRQQQVPHQDTRREVQVRLIAYASIQIFNKDHIITGIAQLGR